MLLARSDTWILIRDSKNPKLLVSPDLLEEKTRTPQLVNRILVPDPLARLTSLQQFDTLRDPVIEFSRSSLYSRDGLMPGRIYAKIGWLREPKHNRAFRSWYASLERWLKKRYYRLDSMYKGKRVMSWWVADEALAWAKSGGRLFPNNPHVTLTVE